MAEMGGGSRTPRELTRAEIDQLIGRNFWGVLAMSLHDEPYAVQIIYGFDGQNFVFANANGRKLATLQENPRVSLVITEVEEYGKRWRSVVARGRVEFIQDLGPKLAAFDTLRKQIPITPQRVRDAAKLVTAQVARLVPSEITGRAAG
jgi:nitroimidazol reductase NimA-like FMN-containing flavoprotein (pyridoxamine 5'-phosphate oxidase superfamily)